MDNRDRSSSTVIVLLLAGVLVLLLLGLGGGGLFMMRQSRRMQVEAELARREAEFARLQAESQRDRGRAEQARTERPAEPDAPRPADPLDDLNNEFRNAYRASRLATVAGTSPVVVVSGDDLILVRNGKRTQVSVVPRTYHVLKSISHVPLALYLLTQSADGSIDRLGMIVLAGYMRKLGAVIADGPNMDLPAATQKRHDEILTASAEYLGRAVETSRVPPEARQAFARKMAPLVMADAHDAAAAQIAGTHKQMTTWKAELSADEWKRLKVVVMGSAMPRQQNLAVQYFAWLLGESGEGKRIVYSESVWDEQKALGLLATHQIDADIGSAFFDDDRRMHRDLLADAAKDILKGMKPVP